MPGVRPQPHRMPRRDRVERSTPGSWIVEYRGVYARPQPCARRYAGGECTERVEHDRKRRVRNRVIGCAEAYARKRRAGVRVRVIEAGENRATAELDAARCAGGEAGDLLARSHGHDSVSSNRYRLCPWTERISRENPAAKEDDVGWRRALVLGESSGREEGKECKRPGEMTHARTVRVMRSVPPINYRGQTKLEARRVLRS